MWEREPDCSEDRRKVFPSKKFDQNGIKPTFYEVLPHFLCVFQSRAHFPRISLLKFRKIRKPLPSGDRIDTTSFIPLKITKNRQYHGK